MINNKIYMYTFGRTLALLVPIFNLWEFLNEKSYGEA
jgi:hypothetical protein